MSFQNLFTETRDRIRYIIINRESKLNALNKATLAELHTAVFDAFHEASVGGIIITGSGPKAFVAGADIAELQALDTDSAAAMARNAHAKVFDLIENGPKPVIAAINGYALGGGLELAMACHLRIAADNAKMGLPEVTLGIMPGYGGTQRLTRLVGRGRALEIILTAEMINAAEAWQFGLVNHVVAADALLPRAEEILQKIMARAPLAVASAICAVNAATQAGVNGFEVEIDEFARCFGTADVREGISAFLNKRKPEFKGN